MKTLKLILLALAPMALSAQSGSYTIKGKIGNYDAPAKVYLHYQFKDGFKTDSVTLKKGAYEFKGEVADPIKAYLILNTQGTGIQNTRDGIDFYIEKGNLSISSPDSAIHIKVKGSPFNEEVSKFKTLTAPIEAKIKSLMNEFQSASEEKKNSKEYGEEMQNRYNALTEERKKVQEDYIAANPDSYLSLDLLKNIGGATPDAAVLESKFNQLSERLRKTEAGKSLAKTIDALKSTNVGSVAQDFTQMDPDNKPVKLSDFKGKYVLIDFWASWCGPCRGENPNVVKAFNQFKDKGFTILGVSLDNDKARWQEAIEKDQLTWTHVSDLKGWSNEVAKLYGIRSIPQNFLIGPDGVIIAKNLRGEALNEELGKIFNK